MELMISRRNSSFCAPAGRALAPAPGTRRRRRGRSRARLVQQDRAGHVAHLLLRVPARAGRASRPARAPATAGRARGRGALGGGDQIGRLLVPKLDLVAEHVDVEQLPHILLLVVLCAGATTSARAGAAAASRGRARACHGVAGRKLLADLAQLLVHADLLLLLVGAVADVRNKGLRGARSDAPGRAGASGLCTTRAHLQAAHVHQLRHGVPCCKAGRLCTQLPSLSGQGLPASQGFPGPWPQIHLRFWPRSAIRPAGVGTLFSGCRPASSGTLGAV